MSKRWAPHAAHSSRRWRAHLSVETLESRVVPYTTSGNAWPHPQLVTISFVPDATNLGGVNSNLFATFNAHPGWTTAIWQTQILKAAQQWAQQTNINFAVVSDNGTGVGGGSYQQGDPGFGDIRFGGYDFGTGDLADASLPPPVNNYSVAGDIDFNTAQPFNIGSTYDLFSVAMHEVGHALGLLHTTTSGAVMQAAYHLYRGLNADDIAGIRNIYSSNNPRSADSYDSGSGNGSFASASNITSQINTSTLTALLTGLDITSTTDLDYYTFTVPSGTTGTMTVKIQSSGLSLLAPTLTIYNSSQTQVGFVSGAGQYGTTLTLTLTGVSAGQQYYVKVAGADTSAFGTGAYAMTLNFGSGANPTVPLPNTQTPNGSPLHSGGGIPIQRDEGQGSPTLITLTSQVAANVGVVTPARVAPSAVAVEARTAGESTSSRPTDMALRVESGGGGDSLQADREDQDDPLPTALEGNSPAVDLPGQASVPGHTEMQAGAQIWQQATAACFEALGQASHQPSANQNEAPAELPAMASPAAALASGAVLLGSFWGRQPERSQERRRRNRPQ